MVYTNETKLQYLFKKDGCRKKDVDEDIKELAMRNIEIGNWYKLLYESILFYGNDTKLSDTFYTGLNVKLLFDSFNPRFVCPFSTTVQWEIANTFSQDTGIILNLKPIIEGISDKYFDVSWLSDYPQEDERYNNLFTFCFNTK